MAPTGPPCARALGTRPRRRLQSPAGRAHKLDRCHRCGRGECIERARLCRGRRPAMRPGARPTPQVAKQCSRALQRPRACGRDGRGARGRLPDRIGILAHHALDEAEGEPGGAPRDDQAPSKDGEAPLQHGHGGREQMARGRRHVARSAAQPSLLRDALHLCAARRRDGRRHARRVRHAERGVLSDDQLVEKTTDDGCSLARDRPSRADRPGPAPRLGSLLRATESRRASVDAQHGLLSLRLRSHRPGRMRCSSASSTASAAPAA